MTKNHIHFFHNKTIHKIVFFLFMSAIFIGSIFIASDNADAATKDYAGFKKAVISAYKNYKTVVDVKSFKLYKNADSADIKNVMTEVINETPYLFYTGQSYSKEIKVTTNQITRIFLTYSKEYKKADGSVDKDKIKKTRAKLDKEIKSAVKLVNSSMTSVEKAMVFHDYIISSTEYSNAPSKPNRNSECGVFLDHVANCQGYSLAYGILLEKAGIPVAYVTSEKMSHMWNLIKIGGKWYNVDVTWDDPIDSKSKKDQYGLVRHEYFMGSTSYFKKHDHSGFSASKASSTVYDNKYWKKVDSAFQYYNGKWIYLNSSGIMKRSDISTGSASKLYSVKGKSLIRFNSSKYYFIANNSIYLYDVKSNTARVVWKTSSKYSRSYYITQIKYSNGKIYYRVLNGSKHTSGSLKVKSNGCAA